MTQIDLLWFLYSLFDLISLFKWLETRVFWFSNISSMLPRPPSPRTCSRSSFLSNIDFSCLHETRVAHRWSSRNPWRSESRLRLTLVLGDVFRRARSVRSCPLVHPFIISTGTPPRRWSSIFYPFLSHYLWHHNHHFFLSLRFLLLPAQSRWSSQRCLRFDEIYVTEPYSRPGHPCYPQKPVLSLFSLWIFFPDSFSLSRTLYSCDLSPQNFIGQAQSGTGKTAAFALSVLARVVENEKGVQAIILGPTRYSHSSFPSTFQLLGILLRCS